MECRGRASSPTDVDPALPGRRLRELSWILFVNVPVGATALGQFLLTTLYMQDVLRWSAIETGVAFIAAAFIASNAEAAPETQPIEAEVVLQGAG